MVAQTKHRKVTRHKNGHRAKAPAARKPQPKASAAAPPPVKEEELPQEEELLKEEEEPKPEDLAKEEEALKAEEAAPALPGAEAEEPVDTRGRERSSYDGDTAIKLYLREIGQVKLLTPQEEIELAARIKKGDKRAREQMIKANLRLVVKIARDYEGIGL
ncbi:MAG TPA: sigma-70 factor domain-containing protein, partial [Bacillota bacterium]|nr:sigma-70 factor domain-containing protein [Bacillota bacterium]